MTLQNTCVILYSFFYRMQNRSMALRNQHPALDLTVNAQELVVWNLYASRLWRTWGFIYRFIFYMYTSHTYRETGSLLHLLVDFSILGWTDSEHIHVMAYVFKTAVSFIWKSTWTLPREVRTFDLIWVLRWIGGKHWHMGLSQTGPDVAELRTFLLRRKKLQFVITPV
jgi:hypothetical protein